ncbi:hypothetical protein FRACYDRAFT_189024 [Fragilariopsis cylindrus CCMP1102]|uniref:UBX domain-containing protein n=1 Tax=Fragilariopsis cylindrus CCMP1102 TaxID=635003 RepID=A0A1E7F595_9STRA|nr:hypothetical protein FRACYDRAFT_189024 [Fragilariopsis cylindrus CCMP1102]|eukprot:OEU13326.1 hypothetical protein FRACYDRAFT_189024 [Fragilariopsis cylindrus CCMP1102]
MDFEDAAVRLARDQSKIRSRNNNRGGIGISEKAKRQAEYQKKIQARLREEREQKKRNEAYQRKYVHDCQRLLKEKSLASINERLFLTPTSIYGDGDKLSLPPSVLETLSNNDESMSVNGGNPWMFRIGIPNPNYKFPSSTLVQALEAPINEEDNDDDMMDEVDDDEEQYQEQQMKPFLQELSRKYISYTHCTVVEFSQEEGNIGIPVRIAQALLDPKNRHDGTTTSSEIKIPTTITVDPASSSSSDVTTTSIVPSKDDSEKEKEMQVENTSFATNKEEEVVERTPGHIAWGAFEIPDVQLEITMVQLPKGTGCTLVPTEEAVRNDFYGLKDVKIVLEQSLIRTRATLTIGDVVSTWHRGKKFDLDVTKVIPSYFRGVTCINTDIEVEIGETKINNVAKNEESDNNNSNNSQSKATNEETGFRLGTGKKTTTSSLLKEDKGEKEAGALKQTSVNMLPISLLPEPPTDKKDGVCTVQIRYSGGNGKRRFSIDTAKVKDLFAFASSLMNRDERSFQLVTRYPRKELHLIETNKSNSNKSMAELTLNQAGLQQGQEMLMVEDL